MSYRYPGYSRGDNLNQESPSEANTNEMNIMNNKNTMGDMNTMNNMKTMGNMSNMENMHKEHEMLIKMIQDCEATCEHMMHHVTMMVPDLEMRKKQLALLHDCADMCALTAKYIARMSVFSKQMAQLCAFVCDTCGSECAKFRDTESQDCARKCRDCARECKEFAMSRY
jgi:hypothetical protein